MIIHQSIVETVGITIKENTKHMSARLSLYQCDFKVAPHSTPQNILDALTYVYHTYLPQLQNQHNHSPITYGNILTCDHTELDGILFDLVVNQRMNKVFSNATFIEQIEYIHLTGLRPEITKQIAYKNVVDFFKFQKILQSRGIQNNFLTNVRPKRIHAVHPTYAEYDDEIGDGLLVTMRKHPNDHTVYVESIESLEASLNHCEPGSTLVIDGHWLHGKTSMHGVWENVDAETLSQNIASLIKKYPGKISKINLLGCESGTLRDNIDETINPSHLFFKFKNLSSDPNDPLAHIANFRTRALYVPESTEVIFDDTSLAGRLIQTLDDKSISVTATPRLGYPYPSLSPEINIASDSKQWDLPHFWLHTERSELYNLCRNTKCVTQQSSPPDESKYINYINLKPST